MVHPTTKEVTLAIVGVIAIVSGLARHRRVNSCFCHRQHVIEHARNIVKPTMHVKSGNTRTHP